MALITFVRMQHHEIFMQRCLQLAALGSGHVAPNPMVGAVLVNENSIIGEGYHAQFGGAHAEVNCLQSVAEANRHLIPGSTLYVSLEPCNHTGKTPPCTNLILDAGIKKVVIAMKDPNPLVAGKGIERLQENGVEIVTGTLETEAMELNKRFVCFHTQQRPYVILKWAESTDGFIARTGESTRISDEITKRLVHKWRTQEQAILIGANTLRTDEPMLTARLWGGNNPIRVILATSIAALDVKRFEALPEKTYIINTAETFDNGNVHFEKMPTGYSIQNVLDFLYSQKIESVLVEGGAIVHKRFLDSGLWDEVKLIRNEKLVLQDGVAANRISGLPNKVLSLGNDRIYYFKKSHVL